MKEIHATIAMQKKDAGVFIQRMTMMNNQEKMKIRKDGVYVFLVTVDTRPDNPEYGIVQLDHVRHVVGYKERFVSGVKDVESVIETLLGWVYSSVTDPQSLKEMQDRIDRTNW